MKAKSFLIISLLSLMLMVSCEKSEIPDRIMVAEGARVCFFNLSTDAPEINLYFNDARVTTQSSSVIGKLRGIPFRSSYPGAVTIIPTTATTPTSYVGAEYFVTEAGNINITAKDTLFKAGHTTFFTTSFNFEKDKYYSVFAAEPKAAMLPVIIEDKIEAFTTNLKTKLRCVNMLSGVAGNKIDLWLIHQPATGKSPIPAYKISSGVDYKGATQFTDTISSGTYKWMVTKAGAVPTANTPPATLGSPYNLTFAAADIVINKATTNTSFSQRTTYSFLLFGKVGGTTTAAPYGNIFRNRLN